MSRLISDQLVEAKGPSSNFPGAIERELSRLTAACSTVAYLGKSVTKQGSLPGAVAAVEARSLNTCPRRVAMAADVRIANSASADAMAL